MSNTWTYTLRRDNGLATTAAFTAWSVKHSDVLF